MDNIRMLDYNLKTHDQNLAAFQRLIERQKFNPTHIVECFGGLGGQTKLLEARWPGLPHVAYEIDEECYKTLAEVAADFPNVDARLGAYETQDCTPNTLLIVDGAITILHVDKYREFVHPDAGYVIFCDFAAGKLHLHRKSYGLEPDATYEDYAEALAEKFGRPLLDFERTPRSMSYVLLGKA